MFYEALDRVNAELVGMIPATVMDAQASAVAYTIVETAKLNGLNPYYYLEHLLTELPRLADKDGNIDTAALDPLLPWAEELPEKCHKPRR